MRRSLLGRLLALALVVAVATVVATAWVTTRTTVQRVTGEFARSLEADAFVYARLLAYATTHADWRQVEPTVEDIADRTGRRIVLTTPDGETIIDTARSADGSTPPVPTVPAAMVDAFTPLDQVTTTTAAADDDTTRSSAGDWLAPPFELSTQAIEDERRAQLEQTLACLQDAGLDVGDLDVDDLAPGNVGVLPVEVVDSRGAASCRLFDAGRRPTTTELQVGDAVQSTATACLQEAGLDPDRHEQVVAWLGPRSVVGPIPADRDPSLEPAPAVDPAGAPDLLDREPRVEACVRAAYRQAYRSFAAPPALLYLDDTTDQGLVARAGGGRLLGALGAVLAVAIGVTVLVGRRLVRPIRELTGAARRMESGERDARVGVSGRDDLARLGHAFNAMAASVEATEQQRRAMVSDVAHELRTPLTNLRGYLEAAQDGVVPLDDELVASLLDESRFVQGLVEDLQQLALADAGQLHVDPVPIDATELAAQVVTAHRARAVSRDVTLTLSDGPACPVHADPGRLRQALGNLVANAIEYTSPGGRVDVAVARTDDTVVLTVRDDGTGIPAAHLPRIFDRFYRADPSRSRTTGGSGLGLAITSSLVEAHGGEVTVQSSAGHGSTFTIVLPGT